MFSVQLLALPTLFSIFSASLSWGVTTVQKADNLEKNYKKLNVEEIANLIKNGGNPTEPLRANTADYATTEATPERTIVISGQGPDSHGNTVQPSIYPFVVAKATSLNGDNLTDEFDAMEDRNGNAFFALYDGHVVRVKGMLLIEVANAVKDLLPLLDMVTNPMITFQENDDVLSSVADQAEGLRNEIAKIIKDAFTRVDQWTREDPEKNQSCTAASVLIVTKYNLIVAWLGDVRVLTYDEDLNTNRLTSDHTIDNEQEVLLHSEKNLHLCPSSLFFPPCELTRSFASDHYRDGKYHDSEPEIRIAPRYFFDETDAMMSTQFVVLETASLARSLEDSEVTDIIADNVKYYQEDLFQEKTMYAAMVDKILDKAKAKPRPSSLIGSDHVLVIGLEKDDYGGVH